MVRKIRDLRIMREERSVADLGAPVLVISQFTLYGDARKGRRPTWQAAAPGEISEPLYDAVCAGLEEQGTQGRARCLRRGHDRRAGQRRTGHDDPRDLTVSARAADLDLADRGLVARALLHGEDLELDRVGPGPRHPDELEVAVIGRAAQPLHDLRVTDGPAHPLDAVVLGEAVGVAPSRRSWRSPGPGRPARSASSSPSFSVIRSPIALPSQRQVVSATPSVRLLGS